MSKFQQNGRHNSYAFILAPCHFCDELVKLHGLGFPGRKIIIEEAKRPPRPSVNKLSNGLANDQQTMHIMPPIITDVRSKITYSTYRRTTSNS